MLITRKAEFCASHVCAQARLTSDENHKLYGAAANASGHGHNYVLEVTLEGEPDPVSGMIFDLSRLKEIIHSKVVDAMDHRFLNYEVAPFDKIVPTAENVAAEIWKRLEPSFRDSRARLRNVRLYETDDLYVDYDGGRP